MKVTHVIFTGKEWIEVHGDLDSNGHGPLYTSHEWDADDKADWELTRDGLLFQGKAIEGSRVFPNPNAPRLYRGLVKVHRYGASK